MKTKLISVVGEDVHTIMITRLNRFYATQEERHLLEETETTRENITVMTIIGGPYVGTQYAHMDHVCLDEFKTVYGILHTEEGWSKIKSGDRLDLQGRKL